MLELSFDDQRALLTIARAAVCCHLSGKLLPVPPSNPALSGQPSGLFVSLHLGTDLRGCIGQFEPAGDLACTTAYLAIQAATRDPRFVPISLDEVPQLSIELSILSPRFPIDPEQIRIGEHGLVVSAADHHGVLLPQVAVEQRWDRTIFLQQTCLKAGLHPDVWKKSTTRIEAFRALVIAERAF